jgi:hypothetical protein
MIPKVHTPVLNVNTVDLRKKKNCSPPMASVSPTLKKVASGTTLDTELDLIWIKLRKKECTQKSIQEWVIQKIFMESIEMDWLNCFNKNLVKENDPKIEILRSIDNKIVDNWAEEKTIGDLINSLDQKELELFYSLKIIDTGKYGDNQLDLSIAIPDQQKEWFQKLLKNFFLN